ncbi:MAG: DHH family phosphoesterase [Oscillospiraceae bacterium]|nr:DHH family phosphoesterase [Oscillospiraceae bacterium]
MKTNKNIRRLSEPGVGVYLFFMILFALAALYFKMYYVAAAEGGVILVLLVYSFIARKIKEKQLVAYIESVTYDSENAKNNTLMHFPLPIAVFRLDDATIVWGNESFFGMCGVSKKRLEARITDLVPHFSGKWLLEGRNRYPTVLELAGKKYQVHGNLVRSEKGEESSAFLGITYWVDITEYEEIRREYEETRLVPGIVVIDNLDELYKNLPERARNDLRDEVEDLLHHWCESYHGILRRFDRDRYLVMLEKRNLDVLREEKFPITEEIHKVESANGVTASISVGLGEEASNLGEAMQYADMAVELALTRGGDQAVVKNRLNFEFFGGRGMEVEKRTKVKSRVMANTLAQLMRDSSKVFVMGHRFADLDCLGACVGVCCMARTCGVRASIVMDTEHNAAKSLLSRLQQDKEYKDVFLSVEDAMLAADGRTLLVVVDTNRPEQVEDADLLAACNRVAVIDHHRVAATYIQNAALGFIEPYASSACELITEILQELTDQTQITRCEAEALLAGIVLDTKSFSLRTGERTFDAAAWLRRAGADTQEVKKFFQSDLEDTIARFKILQSVILHRNVAIAAPSEPQKRVVAAQAADELLNISGVDASIVIVPDGKGKIYASARSIGEMNVQILMEKLGGGGNRSAAAVQFTGLSLNEVLKKVYAAIDEYLEQ